MADEKVFQDYIFVDWNYITFSILSVINVYPLYISRGRCVFINGFINYRGVRSDQNICCHCYNLLVLDDVSITDFTLARAHTHKHTNTFLYCLYWLYILKWYYLFTKRDPLAIGLLLTAPPTDLQIPRPVVGFGINAVHVHNPVQVHVQTLSCMQSELYAYYMSNKSRLIDVS